MDLIDYLNEEWVPALGCTEPASIAYAGSVACEQLPGRVVRAAVTVDPRIYKNCYSVGIPHSGHKTGIKWTAAIGCFLKNSKSKLECFRNIDDNVLRQAKALIDSDNIEIKIDRAKDNLYVDFVVTDGKAEGRCVIEGAHTNVTGVWRDGELTGLPRPRNRPVVPDPRNGTHAPAREWAASLKTVDMLKIVKDMDKDARAKIKNGSKLNIKICEHGLKLFPEQFVKMTETDPISKIAGLVCAGVYARMWGEDLPVMSVAGSGNKGITCTVPLILLQKEWNIDDKRLEEALALAMLFTSKTTVELGTLSAVCGCSNAAGIGLACALVYLKGGGKKEISYAINNMVGNVTGMICDGAKIGCALKTMTAVDAAFRAATLAMSGIGIPVEDGIIGKTGSDSLANIGKIAREGMIKTDDEILKIMETKLLT